MIQAINIKTNTSLMPGISSIIHEYMIQKWRSFYYQPYLFSIYHKMSNFKYLEFLRNIGQNGRFEYLHVISLRICHVCKNKNYQRSKVLAVTMFVYTLKAFTYKCCVQKIVIVLTSP